jgi:hypothetical protein
LPDIFFPKEQRRGTLAKGKEKERSKVMKFWKMLFWVIQV